MSLSGRTFTINENPSITYALCRIAVNFTDGTSSYSCFECDTVAIYYHPDLSGTAGPPIVVYENSEWQNASYRTITFTSEATEFVLGDDISNQAQFEAWLAENATEEGAEPEPVSNTVSVSKLLLGPKDELPAVTSSDNGKALVVIEGNWGAGNVDWDDIANKPSTYAPPLAADGTRGGVQVGYTQSGQNYPVQLSGEKAYVNVPWENTWRGIQNNLNSTSTTDSLSAAQGKALQDGKVAKAGDTMTGSLGMIDNGIDASKANNNVSSTHYPTTNNIMDAANRILTRTEAVVESNGNISAYWYVRNYDTSGNMKGQSGIRLLMDKNGLLTYEFQQPKRARRALFDTNMAATAGYFLTINDDWATGGYVANADAMAIIRNVASGNWAINADQLDGYHEGSFFRYRATTSTSGEQTLLTQIGSKQYNGALPSGLSGKYTYGEVLSFPSTNVRFDIYANHNSSSDSSQGLAYRTGWNNDIKPWVTLLDSLNISTYRTFAYSSGPVAGNGTQATIAYPSGYTVANTMPIGCFLLTSGTRHDATPVEVEYLDSSGIHVVNYGASSGQIAVALMKY